MTVLKKISLLFFTFTYLSLSVGLGFTAHYCHGNLSSLSYITESPDCECGDELSDMSCCSTIQQFYQLDDESLISEFQAEIEPISFVQFSLGEDLLELDYDQSYLVQNSTQESPPKYLLYSALILYA